MTLAPARVCDGCHRFPCRCILEPQTPVYVEPTFRVERCVCGGHITVYEPTAINVFRAVSEHNRTVAHLAWRRS